MTKDSAISDLTFEGNRIAAGATTSEAASGMELFNRDKFLLHQKHLSIDQKYQIFDELGRPILYVKRRAHVLRSVTAIFAGIVAAILVSGLALALALQLPNETMQIVAAIVGILVGVLAAITVATLIVAKRHIEICTDAAYSQVAMTVYQDKKWFIINATYTAADPEFGLLGWFRKNYLYDIFRKRWYVYGPDGSLLCIAMEDSIWRSILRRLAGGSVLAALLRTNFILMAPDSRTKLGEFNRKFTLFDKYVLDLTADGHRALDRRLALALGILLDTGERR